MLGNAVCQYTVKCKSIETVTEYSLFLLWTGNKTMRGQSADSQPQFEVIIICDPCRNYSSIHTWSPHFRGAKVMEQLADHLCLGQMCLCITST
uniref:Uncharacterized protein n=1 Tax=Anguilla anguilla TaxID=7936 RepID=A0A0E9X909_ANGAN